MVLMPSEGPVPINPNTQWVNPIAPAIQSPSMIMPPPIIDAGMPPSTNGGCSCNGSNGSIQSSSSQQPAIMKRWTHSVLVAPRFIFS